MVPTSSSCGGVVVALLSVRAGQSDGMKKKEELSPPVLLLMARARERLRGLVMLR
jgi:hypothetical protein